MSLLHQLKQQFTPPKDALAASRERALQALLQMTLPTRKEPFKYMPLKELFEEKVSFAAPKSAEAKANEVLFINGHFASAHLDPSIVVLPLADALKSYGTFLKPREERTLEKDPFALFNLAFQSSGVFIYVPPKCTQSIRIIDRVETTSDQLETAAPRITLLLGKEAHCSLEIKKEGEGQFIHLSYLDIALEEAAQLKMIRHAASEPLSWQFDALRANLKKDSALNSYDFTRGSRSTRSDMRILLQGEGASATLKGLNRLEGESQAHQHIHIEHQAPNAYSNQHFKTVLKDAAQSSFEGKIYVHKCAQQTLAYQLNNHLLLGEKAIANSKPNLEIFADDVKASHGATMTKLNDEELFYLKSRGLDAKSAGLMLEQGFCQEILAEADDVFASR